MKQSQTRRKAPEKSTLPEVTIHHESPATGQPEGEAWPISVHLNREMILTLARAQVSLMPEMYGRRLVAAYGADGVVVRAQARLSEEVRP